MADDSLVSEIAFDTAEAFLDALSPHRPGALWDREDNAMWIFRGQADANWDLTPAALRKDSKGNPVLMQFDETQASAPLGYSPSEQRAREFTAVVAFMGRTSAAGFEVPGDHHSLRVGFYPPAEKPMWSYDFPTDPYLWSFALAQHYGIPTRLLDWSESAKTATWFAARGAAQRQAERGAEVEGERMAVWAVNRNFIRTQTTQWVSRPAVVTVPTVSNPNLHAQRGLFTLVKAFGTSDTHPENLDACFRAHNSEVSPFGPMLLKLTVPSSEAGYILHCLALEGLDAASLHPWLGAVKDTLLDARLKRRDLPFRRAARK